MIVQRTLLVLLLVIFCGVVFHAPLSVFFGTLLPGFELAVKAWKEVLLAVASLLVVYEVSKRQMWRELSRDWVLRLAAAYVVIHLLMLPFMWQGVTPVVAALMINLRFVMFFVVVYLACRIYPHWRRPVLLGSLIAAGASVLFAVLQVFVLPHDFLVHLGYGQSTIAPYLTVDQNYEFIRINGTLRGPNPLGAYAAIVLAGCLTALLLVRGRIRQIHRALPWLVALLGVGSIVALGYSFSRSAALAALLAVGIVLAVVYGRRVPRAVWLVAGVAGLLLIGGLYAARDSHFVSHVILHEDPNEGNDINSNDGHWKSLVEGTERLVQQPLGAGVGSTGSPSLMTENSFILENYFLYVAHEVGWAGLLLFLALSGTVGYRLWQRRADWLALSLLASGAGLMLASMLLPVWADDTVALVWWGLAGLALAAPVVVAGKKEKYNE